jgi:hypothetical protein
MKKKYVDFDKFVWEPGDFVVTTKEEYDKTPHIDYAPPGTSKRRRHMIITIPAELDDYVRVSGPYVFMLKDLPAELKTVLNSFMAQYELTLKI